MLGQPVRDRDVHGDLGQPAQHPRVVARAFLGPPRDLHDVRALDDPAHDLADAAHPLRVRAEHRDDAEVVKHRLGRHRGGPHPQGGRTRVPGAAVRVEHMDRADHLEVLGRRAGAERHRGRGRGGEDVRLAGEVQEVRCVAAAGALDVERVDRPAGERGERVLHAAAPR